jgi:hypothetical protein
MVLMGPVVLALGVLTACSNPLNDASATVSPTPTDSSSAVVVTPSPTPTPTATTSSSVPQQTGESNPSPFVSTPPPDSNAAKPACSSVWIDGAVLPATYHGCLPTSSAENHLDCNSGPDLWIRNEPNGYEYWAFAGKEINHSKDPNADAAATGKCMS